MEGMALVRVLPSPEEAEEREGGRAVGLRGRAGQGRGSLYQLEEVLPVVLCHEAEESQEGPAERVIAGIAVVGVPPGLDALITLRAMPADRMGTGFRGKRELQLGATWGALREKKHPFVLSAS